MAVEVLIADKVFVMCATRLPVPRILVIALLAGMPVAASAAIGTARAPSDSVHYRSCLSASNLDPAAALTDAEAWAKSGAAACPRSTLRGAVGAGQRSNAMRKRARELDHIAADRGVPDGISFRTAIV